MACCNKKRPILIGAFILIVIAYVTSLLDTPSSSNQLDGIGTLEQREDKSQLWVKALIHEPQKNVFKIGQNATITFRATGKKTYAGIVRQVSALNQYLPQEKVLYITVDDLPKTASIGEQAEILIHIP